MAYKTKIIVNDAYEIGGKSYSDVAPFISNVLLTENTCNDNKLTIGTAAAGQLTFNLYNSPIDSLDGLKIELWAAEDITRDNMAGSFNIDESTTYEDIAEEEEQPTPSPDVPTDAEKNAFKDEWDLDAFTDIDSSGEAIHYDPQDESVSGISTIDEGSNDNYRDDGSIEAVSTMASVVIGDYSEWVPMGIFYVTRTKVYDNYISVVALDGFAKMTGAFNPTSTSGSIEALFLEFVDACENIGIEVESAEFAATNINWANRCTLREAAGIFASFNGAYATFNRGGALELREYMQNDIHIDEVDIQQLSKTLAGGINIDSVACDIATAGSEWIVTPDEAETGANTVYMKNPYMTAAHMADILDLYEYLQYQPCKVAAQWDWTLQAGDIITATYEGETYNVAITNITIDFALGICEIESKGGAETGVNYKSPFETMLIGIGDMASETAGSVNNLEMVTASTSEQLQGLQESITLVQQDVDNNIDDIKAKLLTELGYAAFDANGNLLFTNSGQDYSLELSSAQLSLRKGSDVIAYLSVNPAILTESVFRADTSILSNIKFKTTDDRGNLGIIAQSNGHLVLKGVK